MYSDTHTKELAILSYIHQNSDATQRELSDQVGMSLGAINLLLKRLINKGLVKVDRLTANSVRYFLTPAGIANKVERTYRYIVNTYQEIDQLRNSIVSATNHLAHFYHADSIIFLGPNDDFSLIVQDLIQLHSFKANVSLHHHLPANTTAPIIVWQQQTEHLLSLQGQQSVNIMGLVSIGN
jgi:DNA-binding MarR family transcriptional regulator